MTSLPQAAQIRPMTLADLDRVIEIAASLKEAPQWPRKAYIAALDSEAAPRRIALVADNPKTGSVLGFAIASLLPPESELELIAVDSSFQRQGHAGRLFAALVKELYKAFIKGIMLEVRASNRPALSLYRQLGFAVTGRRPRYYEGPVEDAVLMRLRL
jgi:ribosomal-protein-alanine N-acetyltransferase